MKVILDASALLAWLQDEPGAALVEAAIPENAISSLNWSEALQKSLAHGVDISGLREDMTALGVTILAFDADAASPAARLWSSGGGACVGGSSLSCARSSARRACLDRGSSLETGGARCDCASSARMSRRKMRSSTSGNPR